MSVLTRDMTDLIDGHTKPHTWTVNVNGKPQENTQELSHRHIFANLMARCNANDRVEIGWLFGDGYAFFLSFKAGDFSLTRKQGSRMIVAAQVQTTGNSVNAIDGSRRYAHPDDTVEVGFLNYITLVPKIFKRVA